MTLDVKGWHEREAAELRKTLSGVDASIARYYGAEVTSLEKRAAFHRDAAEYVRRLEEALEDTATRLERRAEDCSCSGGCHYCASDRRSFMRAREALDPYRAPEHPVEPEMKRE